jgi:hypothetical protein
MVMERSDSFLLEVWSFAKLVEALCFKICAQNHRCNVYLVRQHRHQKLIYVQPSCLGLLGGLQNCKGIRWYHVAEVVAGGESM